LLAQLGITSGTVPAYPPAPHCNTRGLTELGRYLERRMMQKHMIINPDHMSQRGVDDTLTLLEAHHYSGVISPHGWMDPGNCTRTGSTTSTAWAVPGSPATCGTARRRTWRCGSARTESAPRAATPPAPGSPGAASASSASAAAGRRCCAAPASPSSEAAPGVG